MTTQHRRLADLAVIAPGFAVKSAVEDDKHGEYQLLSPRQLRDGMTYRYGPQDRACMNFRQDASTMDRYIVRPGDVVLVCRGEQNRAALIADTPERTVATSALHILRPKAGVNSFYLVWLLNQESVQGQIATTRTLGAPMVQRSLLAELMLPLPTAERQEQIAELATLMVKEAALLEMLAERQTALRTAEGKQILRQLGFGS